MSSTGQLDKYKFHVGVKNQWLARPQGGRNATITYVAGTGYTIVITGTGAPASATFPTLKAAKNYWRDFVRTFI